MMNTQYLSFAGLLVFKLLNSNEFLYEPKRQWKVLRGNLIFKIITLPQVYNNNITNNFAITPENIQGTNKF